MSLEGFPLSAAFAGDSRALFEGAGPAFWRERTGYRPDVMIGTPSVGPPVGIRCGNLFVRPPRARRHQSGYVVPRQDPERPSNFVASEVLD